MPQGPGGVILFSEVHVNAPLGHRAIAFVDGQNLFHSARESFACTWPDYDVLLLAQAICAARSWSLDHVRFYTGKIGRAHV